MLKISPFPKPTQAESEYFAFLVLLPSARYFVKVESAAKSQKNAQICEAAERDMISVLSYECIITYPNRLCNPFYHRILKNASHSCVICCANL